MYAQITTRCNMTCAHCCFAATTKGDNMDRATFIQALTVAANYGEFITIGGGEPTAHKEFFEYLEKALEFATYRHGIEGPVMVITNGKLKTKAHRLLDMVEAEENLAVELSQDEWHDPIDPFVVQRFRAHDRRHRSVGYGHGYGSSSQAYAGIRTVSQIVPVGRAADAKRGIVTTPYLKCCCETWLVDPRGDVWSCGCKHTKLGTIWDDGILDGYNQDFAHQGGFDLEAA